MHHIRKNHFERFAFVYQVFEPLIGLDYKVLDGLFFGIGVYLGTWEIVSLGRDKVRLCVWCPRLLSTFWAIFLTLSFSSNLITMSPFLVGAEEKMVASMFYSEMRLLT